MIDVGSGGLLGGELNKERWTATIPPATEGTGWRARAKQVLAGKNPCSGKGSKRERALWETLLFQDNGNCLGEKTEERTPGTRNGARQETTHTHNQRRVNLLMKVKTERRFPTVETREKTKPQQN